MQVIYVLSAHIPKNFPNLSFPTGEYYCFHLSSSIKFYSKNCLKSQSISVLAMICFLLCRTLLFHIFFSLFFFLCLFCWWWWWFFLLLLLLLLIGQLVGWSFVVFFCKLIFQFISSGLRNQNNNLLNLRNKESTP